MKNIELAVFDTDSVRLHEKGIILSGRWSTPKLRLPDVWTTKFIHKNNIARVDIFGDYIVIPKDLLKDLPSQYTWPKVVEYKTFTLKDWKAYKTEFEYFV